MRYVNPSNGKYAMATMATFMQLLPRGFATAAYRSTDATVFVPIEGRGRSRIGKDVIVEWSKRDIFVAPLAWQQVNHEADEDSVLFSFSDRPVQEALYLLGKTPGTSVKPQGGGRYIPADRGEGCVAVAGRGNRTLICFAGTLHSVLIVLPAATVLCGAGYIRAFTRAIAFSYGWEQY